FFQAEDGIRDFHVTGVQTCALPIYWIGVRNKYFAAIISPDNPAGVEGAYVEGFRKLFQNQGIKESYSVRLTLPFRNSDYEKNSLDRKSTRLNSSHVKISYAVFCLKK